MLDHEVDTSDREALECFCSAVKFLSSCSAATKIAGANGKADFLDNRLKTASNEQTLLDAFVQFRRMLNVGPRSKDVEKAMMAACSSEFASRTLMLLRSYPTEVVHILFVKEENKEESCSELFYSVSVQEVKEGSAPKRRVHIPLTLVLTEPLIHGHDEKQGNATLFRRRPTVMGVQLPFFSANATCHYLRTLLADDFFRRTGLHPSITGKLWKIWFLELINNGGKMGQASKELCKKIGGTANGAIRSDGIKEFRNMFPFISLFGGNAKSGVESRANVHDLRPVCHEWGTGDIPCNNLLGWEFGVTFDPLSEVASSKADAKKDSNLHALTTMPYSVQSLVVGTELEGGFGLTPHATEVERSCLGHGIDLFIQHGRIGGKTHKGYGGCNITCETKPDPQVYLDYIEETKEQIVEYVDNIGATEAKKDNFDYKGGPL